MAILDFFPSQIPHTVGQSYSICRSGSKHPTETARSKDSERRWRGRDEHSWPRPRLIPLVPVRIPWLEAVRTCEVVDGKGIKHMDRPMDEGFLAKGRIQEEKPFKGHGTIYKM